MWPSAVAVRSRTSDSEVAGNLKQVIYTHGAQANSALYPSGNE